MEQNRIKKRFLLCYIMLPLTGALLATLFYNIASVTSSDIYYKGAASLLLRAVPFICQYAYILFDRLFIGAASASVIYAATYFGRKTALNTSLCTLGIFLFAELAGFVYTVIVTNASTRYMIATLISVLSELLFCAAVLAGAIIGASVFLKKRHLSPRRNRSKLFSEYSAAVVPSALSALIMVVDLTLFNVIPFFMEYDNILPSEIADIIFDYLYYLGIYLVLTYLLSCLMLLIITRITGKLKPKKTGA